MNEIWRPVVGFAGYEVSNLGRVRSCFRTVFCMSPRGSIEPRQYRGRLLKPGTAAKYKTVALSVAGVRKCVNVHQLVAEAFLGPAPRGQEIRHWDGDSFNCAAGNLLYGTRSENAMDKHRHGTMVNGYGNFSRG